MKRAAWVLLLLFGCGRSALAPEDAGRVDVADADVPVERLDVPIELGQLAFNDPENSGFDGTIEVTWRSSDLLLTSDGRVEATVETASMGPAVPGATRVEDALFWQVRGRMTFVDFGDGLADEWSEVIGVRALASSTGKAAFRVRGRFNVPPPSERQRPGLVLAAVELNLTWVRAWQTPAGTRYQVLAGHPEFGDPGGSAVFDELPTSPRGARFGYYAPRPTGALAQGPFDYVAWFAAH